MSRIQQKVRKEQYIEHVEATEQPNIPVKVEGTLVHKLNINRQLITLCAKLQHCNSKPRIEKRCPITLAAGAKGRLFNAIALKNLLAWKEHPNSIHWMKAVYSPTIIDWVNRFDRHYKYSQMLCEHVPPIVVWMLELPILAAPAVRNATHIATTRPKLGAEYIQQTPRMCRPAISPTCYDKILVQPQPDFDAKFEGVIK